MKKYRAEIRFFKQGGNILDQMDVEADSLEDATTLIEETVFPALHEITSIGEVIE